MKKICTSQFFIACSLFLIPISARADLVWPAFLLETRLATWWAVLVGLVIEFLFYKYGFNLTIKKAILVDIVLNTVSALIGLVAIPITGFIFSVFSSMTYEHALHLGTFNPIEWCGTFVLAVLITTLIEYQTLVLGFKIGNSVRGYLIVLLANTLSVGVAFVSIFIVPVQT